MDNPTTISPGITRLRFGAPEPHTPITFRSNPPDEPALAKLPAAALPIDPAQIRFTPTARGCTVIIPGVPHEKRYGLGLNTKVFELSGRTAFVVPSDHPEEPTNESHAPVPFYITTAGYGVFVDTARFATFYFGSLDPADKPTATTEPAGATATSTDQLYAPHRSAGGDVVVDIPAAHGVDIYLIAGPTMLDVVRRFNLFSGGGCIPPLWGLGIAYRGKSSLTADESVALAKSVRDEKMPCDQWGVEPGWLSHSYSTSFIWDQKRFPDPDAFIAAMHRIGYRLNFWEHVFVHPSAPVHEPLLPLSGDYKVWGGLVPDLSLPKTREIFQQLHEKILFGKGADAVKLDECDFQPFKSDAWSFPLVSAFPSGLDGEQMHSLIGLLYQQTLLQPAEKTGRRTWGLSRNSHALAATLPYTIYSDSYDHACYIRGMCKAGFGGLLWTPEVRDATTVEELYRRIQTVIFSPYAMINCWYMKDPPWRQIDKTKNNAGEWMDDHIAVTEVVRGLFNLRMSLIPYLYSAFNDYRRTGTPPVRAMVLDFPTDAKLAAVDDQFMFGPSLLVAPLLAGHTERKVHLPAGDWHDFWTGEKKAGPAEITVKSPIEQVPIYVRGDTLLPLADPVERIADDTVFAITVRVFGSHPAPFRLHEDDGVTVNGGQNTVDLSWDGGTGKTSRSGNYQGAARYEIKAWKV